MKARLAVVILAAPMWVFAADSGAKGPAASGLSAASHPDRIQPAMIQTAQQSREELSTASWSSAQAIPARATRTESVTEAPSGGLGSDSLPNSGLQFYALIAAGIAAIGFMASRRTGS